MKQKMMFTNLFMTFLVICTIMYQSVHSFTHVLEEINQSYVSNSSEHKHIHLEKKHCHVCDFTFSPFTTTEFLTYTFINPVAFSHKYFFSEITFENSIIQHSFLRGPPAFV